MDEKIDKNCISKCFSCPVRCGADRNVTVGACGVKSLRIAKYYLHPFEEPCISHANGSGTIFFCGCNLQCVFCQNYELSRAERGLEVSPKRLAEIFQELENAGADNVSLVTPSHVIPFLIEAFSVYRPRIPVVYNSSGYDDIEALKKIDPFIDIYLPDFKFFSPDIAKRYTGRSDYPKRAKEAIKFMAKKPVLLNEQGKMLSGIIVRHLVMPLCKNDSISLLKWLKKTLPPTAFVSIMRQYTPFGKIEKYPELQRKITAREYSAVVQAATDEGFENLYIQEKNSSDEAYIPKWDY